MSADMTWHKVTMSEPPLMLVFVIVMSMTLKMAPIADVLS
jgi:hypothetical protein